MNGAVIGLDTSNYRTSLAAVSQDGKLLMNRRELLPVPEGARGLRQSDAVYAHLKHMKSMLDDMRSAVKDHTVLAVCASAAPRDRADSYMPVFEVGDTLGRAIAGAMGIPFFQTDHQHGHIRAALHGTELEKKNEFLALHLSGGTTDLLAVKDQKITELGRSLDLHAGQLVDRIGVALGMLFPAGPDMEKLAVKGNSKALLGCSMENGDLSCHLSGAESQAQRWIQEGKMSRNDICLEIYDLLARVTARMLCAGCRETGFDHALICGGIASSYLYRKLLLERLEKLRNTVHACFGTAELCGDNAVGVALIGLDQWRKCQ